MLLYALALPFLLLTSLMQKYRYSIPARFFLYNNPPFKDEGGVHFHACSLGETRALKPIIDEIKNSKITTITQTGQAEALKYGIEARYLPYEIFLPFWLKRSDLLVVMEAEFWYLLFLVAKLKGARVVLLNARISERSFARYKKFAWVYSKIFSLVDLAFVQSSEDEQRFRSLGLKGEVVVSGNIKLATKVSRSKEYAKPEREVIVAASTHEGEEELILKAFVEYKKVSDALLFVVPRHPERFERVYELCKKTDLSVSRFSKSRDFATDIVLVDAMGELNNIYAISDVAILGGAFRDDVGGHNPLEPAEFGCKIVTGKHFFHQKELFKYVANVEVVDSDEILPALKSKKESSFVTQSCDLAPIIERLKR